MGFSKNEREYIRRFYRTLLDEFGPEKGMRIIELLAMEFGGQRVTIPGHRTLAREERARRIQNLYDTGGFTMNMLALRFGITIRQVQKDLKQRLMVPEM